MAELIEIRLKRIALALATTLDYASAAAILEISEKEVRSQIKELEDRLCLHIFEPHSEQPLLTIEGRFLVQRMRETLAHVERANGEKDREESR